VPKPKTKRASWLITKSNLLTNLILVLPLLLFYELGVLFADVMNAADFITSFLLRSVGIKGFIGIQLGLFVGMVGVAFYLSKKQQFNIRIFIPVILESAIYALTMGTFIIYVMVDLLHINPQLAASNPLAKIGLFDRLVLSVGAGVHEELVFRLLLLGGLALIGERLLNLRRWVAIIIAFAVSSLLFSAAHHLGAMGEPLRFGVFTYRLIAGISFGLLFQFRGFAIAVYTHALYDIYVLLLR
jgi:membrane protease YdiL (CAAX protease family)